MIKLQLFLGFLTFALWVYCLVNVITTDDSRIRNLPKIVWLLLVVFLPFIGSLAWLIAGRPRSSGSRPVPSSRPTPAFPEYDRPGRAAARDDAADEEFLKNVRARAEEQRKRHELARRERERQLEEERQRYRKPKTPNATPNPTPEDA